MHLIKIEHTSYVELILCTIPDDHGIWGFLGLMLDNMSFGKVKVFETQVVYMFTQHNLKTNQLD